MIYLGTLAGEFTFPQIVGANLMAAIAIVVLGASQWPVLRLHIQQVAAAINAITPGSYTEINIPRGRP